MTGPLNVHTSIAGFVAEEPEEGCQCPAGIAAGAGVAAVPALSYLVEALRSEPATPQAVDWAPAIPVRRVEVDGARLRYVTAGSGVPIVPLHALRTQLDMFQKVIPALAERFQVYALDYPGHGYSDIPEMYRVGSRRGHYVALMSLVRHWPEWEQARREYGAIQRPVLLLYGGEDWSHEPERESNHRAIPGSRMRITPNAGHFFALDDPDELIRSIREFSDLLREPATAVRP